MIITLVLMVIAAILILSHAKKGAKNSASAYESRSNTPVSPSSPPKAAPSIPSSPSSEQAVLRFSREVRGWLHQIAVLAEACMPNRYSPHSMMIFAMWKENDDVGPVSFALIADTELKDRVAALNINLADSGIEIESGEFSDGNGRTAQGCSLKTSLEHYVMGISKFLGIDNAMVQRAKLEGSVDLCSSDTCKILEPVRREMKGRLHDSRDIKILQAKLSWAAEIGGYVLHINLRFE